MNAPFPPPMNISMMRRHLEDIAKFVASDRHGNLRRDYYRAAVDVGLLDAMPFDPDMPPPFPALDELTATQVTLFDNWPNGKAVKSKPFRYAVTLNGWTVPAKGIHFAKKNWQVKANATLYTAEQLSEKIPLLTRSSLKNPISEDYAALLTQFAESLEADRCVFAGPLFVKGRQSGTTYYDEMVIVFRIDELGPMRPSLFRSANHIDLNPFVDSDASGRTLKQNATYQSRTSADPLLANWTTR